MRIVVTIALAGIFAAAAEAWKPVQAPIRSQWCEQHLRMPTETSAQPGRFDLRDHSYLREILDAVDDLEVRKIVIRGATQIGKTELVRAIILSQGEVARAPMMFAGPDAIYVREQKIEVYRRAEACEALRSRIPPPRLRNDRAIDLGRCLIYLAWSGSSQRLSGRSCKIVLCSEADRWRKPVGLAEERTKAFPDNYCVIIEGTPVNASSVVDPEYRATDRRSFQVPCPKCGHRQELRFFPHRNGPFAGCGGVAGLRDAKGNWLKPEEARQAAYYVCEKGCKITDDDKPAMVRAGVWCPDGCKVDRRGKITGKPQNPGRRRGYRLNSLYATEITFGAAADKYLSVRDNQIGLAGFFNDWLGLPFLPRGSTPRWKELGERLASDYPRGTVPRGAYFLVAGADVQETGVYWVVRGFGDHKTSWLVDFGFLPRPGKNEDASAAGEILAGDLVQLDDAVVNRRWNVLGENPLGRSQLQVRLLGIDRGYRPTEVLSYIRARPGGRVVPVFGDPKIVQGTLYRIAAAERDAKTGRKVEGGIMAWGIETNAYKSEVSDRWMADRTHPGVWWLPRDILETDGGEDYLRQVTAESRSLEVRNGRKAIVWQLIAHGQANHFFDCETYIAALADMVTGGEWATLDKRAAAIKTKRAAKSKTSQAARQKTGSPQPYGRIRS